MLFHVIGDIVEQGSIEKEEHEKLADLIAGVDAEEIILVGRRTKQYTAPKLKELGFSPKTLSASSVATISFSPSTS